MSLVSHIFRWDLDKTYLRTDFDSVRGLVRTARATAEERENIPGSAALIRAIRSLAPESERHQIYFISGSPKQLRTVLERKFELDGFSPDGIILKPMASEIFRGRFRSVRGQVAYKLSALLGGRSHAPVGTKETLVGDDAESDVFIYSLYADLLRGRVDKETLVQILRRSGAYRDQVALIEHELEGVVHENAVRRIVIHLDQLTPPAYFHDYFPRVVPIYNHLQTAIVLAMDGTVPAPGVRAVARELLGRFEFTPERLVHLAEDIMRRLRLIYPAGTLDRLAEQLRLPSSSAGPSWNKEVEQAVEDTIAAIQDRARYVAARPEPKEDIRYDLDSLDYIELYDKDEERREEAKRARKLAKEQAEAAAKDRAKAQKNL